MTVLCTNGQIEQDYADWKPPLLLLRYPGCLSSCGEIFRRHILPPSSFTLDRLCAAILIHEDRDFPRKIGTPRGVLMSYIMRIRNMKFRREKNFARYRETLKRVINDEVYKVVGQKIFHILEKFVAENYVL